MQSMRRHKSFKINRVRLEYHRNESDPHFTPQTIG